MIKFVFINQEVHYKNKIHLYSCDMHRLILSRDRQCWST